MKSHQTRYSPKYFADFAEAFKPTAKFGGKLTTLVRQARQSISQHARTAKPVIETTEVSTDPRLYMDNSSIHDQSDATASDQQTTDKIQPSTKGKRPFKEKAAGRTPPRNDRRKTLAEEMLQKTEDDFGKRWYCHQNAVPVCTEHHIKTVEKLAQLREIAWQVENDCYRPVEGYEPREYAQGEQVSCHSRYSWSDVEDECQLYFRPTYDIKKTILSMAERAEALIKAALLSGTSAEKREAKDHYETIAEFLDGLPVTYKPDHIVLKSERDGDPSSLSSDSPNMEKRFRPTIVEEHSRSSVG